MCSISRHYPQCERNTIFSLWYPESVFPKKKIPSPLFKHDFFANSHSGGRIAALCMFRGIPIALGLYLYRKKAGFALGNQTLSVVFSRNFRR